MIQRSCTQGNPDGPFSEPTDKELHVIHRIHFKVASVSENRNAFGLRGHILVSREGVAYEVGLNYLNELKKDTEVEVVVVTGDPRPGSITDVRDESEEKPTHEQVMSALTRKLSGEIPRQHNVEPAARASILPSLACWIRHRTPSGLMSESEQDLEEFEIDGSRWTWTPAIRRWMTIRDHLVVSAGFGNTQRWLVTCSHLNINGQPIGQPNTVKPQVACRFALAWLRKSVEKDLKALGVQE